MKRDVNEEAEQFNATTKPFFKMSAIYRFALTALFFLSFCFFVLFSNLLLASQSKTCESDTQCKVSAPPSGVRSDFSEKD